MASYTTLSWNLHVQAEVILFESSEVMCDWNVLTRMQIVLINVVMNFVCHEQMH